MYKEASKSLSFMWEFPVGKIEEGESPQEALKVEIDEEMHCSVQIGEQIDYTAYEYDFGIIHLKSFYCKLVEGIPFLLST